MGKITIHQEGSVKIKMDTKDDIYYDAKDPHVSFEQNGRVTIKHLSLSEVDSLVGRNADEKKAIYWVREKKNDLEKQYYQINR